MLEKLDWVTSRGDFMLGAIAPDAVHFCENYQVQDLKRVILRNRVEKNIGEKGYLQEEPMKVAEQEVVYAYQQNTSEQKEHRSGQIETKLTMLYEKAKRILVKQPKFCLWKNFTVIQ